MRRQRTEVVVELRKVNTFVILSCQLQTELMTCSNYDIYMHTFN